MKYTYVYYCAPQKSATQRTIYFPQPVVTFFSNACHSVGDGMGLPNKLMCYIPQRVLPAQDLIDACHSDWSDIRYGSCRHCVVYCRSGSFVLTALHALLGSLRRNSPDMTCPPDWPPGTAGHLRNLVK